MLNIYLWDHLTQNIQSEYIWQRKIIQSNEFLIRIKSKKSLARANELPDYSEVAIETLKIIESQNN